MPPRRRPFDPRTDYEAVSTFLRAHQGYFSAGDDPLDHFRRSAVCGRTF